MMRSRVKKSLLMVLVLFVACHWSWADGTAISPLSEDQIALYEAVFEAQESGHLDQADLLLKRVTDDRLMAYVLSQRYLHPYAYRSSFQELQDWLVKYNTYPEAERIYKLAVARKPDALEDSRIPVPRDPESFDAPRKAESFSTKTRIYKSDKVRSSQEQARVKALHRTISEKIRAGQMEAAYKALDTKSAMALLDTAEYDRLLGEIAAGFLYNGARDQAFALAQRSVKRSGLDTPKAGWVAGLAAWHKGEYESAAQYFEVASHSPYASEWMVSAGAYWAARAHMRVGNVKAVSAALHRGGENGQTFYGLIATRALGQNFAFQSDIPTFTKPYHDVLMRMPAADRALALVACGRKDWAEAELMRVNPDTLAEREALLSYAGYAELKDLQEKLTGGQGALDQSFHSVEGRWVPEDGYSVDPALIHAIMNQESRFDPKARSVRGARGLMQLMPATARSVVGRGDIALDNPETNIKIGQMYLEKLLKEDSVQGNLFYLMVAYNAGPGNLSKWKKRWPDVTDPLLFIELIPSAETRAYVERVLARYWVYRLEQSKPVPSLDAVASGKEARYIGTPL